MKNKFRIISILSFIFLLMPAFSPIFSDSGENIKRKIIVFKDGELKEEEKDDLISSSGGVKLKDLDLIKGKAVLISKEGENKLLKNKEVLRVDDDIIIEALDKDGGEISGGKGKSSSNNTQPAQIIPWGIRRIGAPNIWVSTTADVIKMAIIDTGIELSHPDLSLNIKGGYNAIDSRKSANDDNGHGTHVAGVAAALNNSIGVAGVGTNIDLYAVKVLNRNGSGFLSDIIEGIDWAIQNKIQVINMSLGTRSDIESFHDAVIRAYNAGVVIVAAAGNDFGGAVNFPAAYPEAIAVSATDEFDNIAPFSSIGPEVDFAAPGVNIFSTYKGKAYRTLNGTSMASPHVAGTAALVLSVTEKCDTDLNGVCSPLEVKQRMETAVLDLGILGFDNLYGSGLISAEKAVTQ